MVRQHHQIEGHEFEQTPGDSAGQGSLACCSSWGRKELRTQQLNNDNRPIKILFSNQAGVLTNRTLVIYVQIYHCLLLLIDAKSCPALCDPMDCSLPSFSIHGIFQARIQGEQLFKITFQFPESQVSGVYLSLIVGITSGVSLNTSQAHRLQGNGSKERICSKPCHLKCSQGPQVIQSTFFPLINKSR